MSGFSVQRNNVNNQAISSHFSLLGKFLVHWVLLGEIKNFKSHGHWKVTLNFKGGQMQFLCEKQLSTAASRVICYYWIVKKLEHMLIIFFCICIKGDSLTECWSCKDMALSL